MNADRNVVLFVAPFEFPNPSLVAAASRAGALGILDLGRDPVAAADAVATLVRARVPFGVRVPEGSAVGVPEGAVLVIGRDPALWPGHRVLVEITTVAEAERAEAAGAAGLVAKGSESGGRVGEESTFVLLQRVIRTARVPVWAQGGIGLHSAAAAIVGGAAGVVLDSQLALLEECRLPEAVRAAVAAMDGSETRVVGDHRVYTRPGLPIDTLAAGLPGTLGAGPLDERLLPAGQDAALASILARRFPRTVDLVRALRRTIAGNRGQAASVAPLAPGSAFAREHGLRYPIVQGPMTRVSDTPEFALAVAEAGGLPFLALSLLSGRSMNALLDRTKEVLGDRPWGVGMLGFAPKELRDEQIEAVRRVRPPVALLAGGRPAQARALEDEGIPTYLHVPSPGLLDLFLADGARRFVFEGRECGGHVGPRTSFVLWEQVVERLLRHEAAHELSVIFAGGIHDARSASMVATLTAPLAVRGARVAALMGTAYLFTEEAVRTGAISPVFQEQALACEGTVLVHTAPGHATRCADSAFVSAFAETRARLEAEGAAPDAIWEALERLNLGRLRIASKGLRRDGDALVTVDARGQRDEGMFMIGQLAALRGEVTTIARLHAEVSEGSRVSAAVPTVRPRAGMDIAIVGMAGVFPGAPDLDAFWSNIVLGRDAVTEVPTDRWNPALYYDPGSMGVTGKTRSKWGGFLPAIPFDPLEYGIPPRSLAAIEPVQLLALHVAARALEDAGWKDRPWDRERTSVVFGAEAGTDLASAYGFRALLPTYVGEIPQALDAVLPRLTEDSFPGVLGNVIAGRIANRLDLGGINYTVDAACASSLAALDVACKELMAGTSDAVVVGGADLHNAIGDYLLFDSVHALSPTGRSRPFAADADGIALGEGVAALVVKRLADAERDGDRIYAVVRSIAGSSDGRSLGLTAPRREGQILALERAYDRAGISPDDVELVEAHGTGTVVGDRTELSALTEVFTRSGVGPASVTLGSVKSNVGHTKCAAGLAGLVKTALALHHGVLPPSLHVRQPNPGWRGETSPFVFRGRPAPWTGAARYAGVSAFGFGGTNFHAVLGAHGDRPPVGPAEWPAEVFLFRDAADLDRVAARLEGPVRMVDLSRALARRGEGPVILAIVARDSGDLRRLIGVARTGGTDESIVRPDAAIVRPDAAFVRSGTAGQVAWLYPGQGSQRPGMLAELFVAFPELQGLLGESWAARLFPGDSFDPETKKAQRAAITDTRVAQPALGIVELAASRVLARLGLVPDALAGHSYGELVALCVAGALPPEQLVELSVARGNAILGAAGADPGTMAAISASPATVGPHLDGTDVVIANSNSPTQTVIAGPTEAVRAAVARFEAAGIEVRTFPAAAAFHSPVVAGAEPALAEALRGFDVGAPVRPVWANTTAALYPADAGAVRAQLAQHLVRPVRWVEQIEAMYDSGVRTFVEVGPGRVLTDLVRAILGGRAHRVLPLDGDGGALVGLVRLVAALATSGVAVDLDALLAARGAVTTDLDAPRPALSATAWWVDGQRAWPDRGALPDHAMQVVREPLSLGGTGARDRVVLQYLQTLQDQAEAQRKVMLAYLGNAPADTAVDAPALSAPAVAAVAAPTLAPGELLLNIVSERTGYPAEMLDLDLDLEADLSIDSIKRVEILGVLADKLGDGGTRAEQEQVVEQLAGVRTLRGILGWIEARRERRAGAPEAALLPDDPSSEDVPSRALRFVPELLPLDAPAAGSLADLRVGVVGAGALCDAVERSVLAAGGRVVRLAVDGSLDGLSELVVVTDPTSDVEGAGGERLYALADLARRALGSGVGRIRVVTWSGGRLGHGAKGTHPYGVGVSGLVKTVAKEWPQGSVRRIDLDPDEAAEDHATHVLAELLDATGPSEVGYRGQQRVGRRFAPHELDVADSLALGADAVVLLTGGARGITAQVARGLAERYRCTLILVGRSAPPEPIEDPAYSGAATEKDLRSRILARGECKAPADVERRVRRLMAERGMRETFDAIRAAGAAFEYHALDVRDADAVGALLERVYAAHGRIDVLLHGAGVNEDKLLRDKTRESFLRVFDTKVVGAHNLVRGLRADTRAIVFFSSVAGAFGNRGQADYAAANDALDELAHGLNDTLDARVLSIGWGPWGGGGMVTPELERQYAQRGVGVIDPIDGVQRLLNELASGQQAQVVLMAALPDQMV